MENRREEIKGLKRLLVGVIVSTLLITMLPFESMGTFVARAENVVTENMPESLSEHELFLNAAQVMVNNVEELQQILSENDFATTYSNGVIIKYEGEQDLDFSGADLIIPAGFVGVELGGASIINIGSISFDLKTTSSSTEYGYNFFVLGDNANSTIAFVEGEAEKTIWQVEPNQQVVLYGVDVVNADIIVSTSEEDGSAFGYDGIYYELPDGYDEDTYRYYDWYAMYREGKGVFRYENGTLYADKLYSDTVQSGITDGVYQLMLDESLTPQVDNYSNYINKVIYTKEAMEYIATEGNDCKLGCFDINTYENPKTELVVDSNSYGVYSITDKVENDESKHVMTLYEYIGGWGNTEQEGDTSAYVYIGEYFFEGTGSEAESVFDEVIFTDGAIPMSYEISVSDGDNVTYEEFPVSAIQLGQGGNDRGTPEFIFDLTSWENLIDIYNTSKDKISVIDSTEQNTVWAQWSTVVASEDMGGDWQYLLEVANATMEGIDSTLFAMQFYVKAGSTFTVIPNVGYTIYDIQYGACGKYEDDTGVEYEYEEHCSNLATTDYVKINTDGSVLVTVPTSRAGFFASSKEMETVLLSDTQSSKNYVTINGTPYSSSTEENQTVDCYTESFAVDAIVENEYTLVSETEDEVGGGEKNYIKHIYEICDEATTSDEGWSASVSATQECINKEHTYYVIDRSMEKIEYIYVNPNTSETETTVEEYPASTYGEIRKLTYTYSLDYDSPVVKDILATNKAGNEIDLKGVWYDGTEVKPGVETVWTSETPVILEVVSDDTDILEYAYVQSEDLEWISTNTTEITEDGIYDLEIYVRDEFDATTGRTGGRWLTSLGVDTIAPILYYTDANYASADVTKELASNSEYEGNLFITVEENGSGFSSISLEKDNNGTWEPCSDALKNGSVSGQYYIAPTTEDVTYRIVVEDAVGNIREYNEVTLNGYMQDISVEVTNNTGVYNQELTVNVRITNTSTTNSIENLTYVIRESDTVFTPVSGEIATLAGGASHDITLNIPVGTNAGEYLSTLDIQYTSTGNLLENTIEKAYSQEITAVLEKAEGEGSISVDDYYFGQSFTYTANSTTHQTASGIFYFRDALDETAEYTTEVPTAEGTYIVRAEFTGEVNYTDLVVEDEFTILRKQATEDMYIVPEADEATGWYGEAFVITAADGNTLSTEEDGEFVSELRIEESTESYQFYIKTADGAITNAVELYNISIDNVAPVISVLGVSTAELVSGETYSENLHLDIQDAGIGEGTITLSSDIGEILKASDGTYYILQTTEDVTYTIVGTDALGNTVTYQNIVVKAYEKDIVVSIENTEGQYNAELAIQITIQNTGKDAINITTLELDKEVSDSAFTSALEPTTLVAGERYIGYVYLPAGTAAGEYSAIVNIDYITVIPGLEVGAEKSYTESISATIAKIAGAGSITVEDLKYGEEFAYKAESATNGTEGVVLYFKESGNETAEYITDVPTQAGNYEVKAVFPANENYLEVIATDTFTISRLAATTEMYSISAMDEATGWYNEDVVITAKDGYTISTTEEGEFVDTLTISSSVESFTFYVKTETGIVTEAVVLGAYQIDKTAPEIAENEGIYAVETWWQSFLEIITFGTYEAETTKVEIKAHDEESGIANISYYISTEAITLANIDSVAEWTEGAEVSISKEDYEQFILYAKVENEAGLVTYLSTDGIKLGVTETPVEPVPPVEPEVPVQPEPTPPVEDDPIEDIIEEIVSKITGGKVNLKKGTPYQLDAGSWNVAGDETTYSGGITFYVDEEGEYEFTQN